MKQALVRYKLKPGRQGENKRFVEAVFQALQAASPPGIRYASIQLDDGLSFMHVALIDTDDGSNPLSALPAFKAFTQDIAARCDEPPQVSDFDIIGNYHLFN